MRTGVNVSIHRESRGSKAKALAEAKPLRRSAILKRKRASRIKAVLKILGPGLITGAADDDPSGIATYSSVGAQFGYGMLWTMPLIYPFMAAIQQISARIGRVTGHGIAGNMRRCYPRWLVCLIVALLLFANVINLGADIGAMGAAVNLLIRGPTPLYCVILAGISLLLQVWIPYQKYAAVLKWLHQTDWSHPRRRQRLLTRKPDKSRGHWGLVRTGLASRRGFCFTDPSPSFGEASRRLVTPRRRQSMG